MPAAEPRPAPVAPPAPVGAEVGDAPLPPVPPRAMAAGRAERIAGVVAWLVLALLVLTVAGLYVGRARVVELAPSMETLYRRLGVATNPASGLEVRNHTSVRATRAGRPTLEVRGEIANTTDETRTLPQVRVALLDAHGSEVAFGLFAAVDHELKPGAVTTFDAELPDPPDSAVSYRVALVGAP